MCAGIRGGDQALVDEIRDAWSGKEVKFKILCRGMDFPIEPGSMKRREGTYENGCPNLLWELLNIRRKENTAVRSESVGTAEGLVDKDNDAWDDCFDPETEILTDSGWKRFYDLAETDKVATWISGVLVFEKPLKIIAKPYSGEMLSYKNRNIDFMVTPTHRLFVSSQMDVIRRHNPKFKFKTPDELDAVMWTPRTAKWEGMEISSPIAGVSTDDFIAWYGFWLAEGCKSTNRRGSYYAHIYQNNPDEEVVGLMERCRCTSIQIDNRTGQTRFNFGVRWFEVVKDQGLSHNKTIPSWIKSATPRQLEILLYWMWKGDASKANDRYNTVSRALADDVQEALLKCGYGASLSRQPERMTTLPSGKTVVGRAVFHVHKQNGRHGQGGVGATSLLGQIKKSRIKKVSYEGKVYCVSVKSGVILVRRNGKPMWSGNCKYWWHSFPETPQLSSEEKWRMRKAELFEDNPNINLDSLIIYKARFEREQARSEDRSWR